MLPPAALAFGPSVIGATGGSGTRAFARIARLAGLYTGTDLNASEDALPFGAYSDRWINEYVRRRGIEEQPFPHKEMDADLRQVLHEHLAGYPGAGPWGWKEPRSIFLLPFFHSRLPGLRFLHVVRDGRDMALSTNQNQLHKHGRALLGRVIAENEPRDSIALWSRVNLDAAEYGERKLKGGYLRLRFEDLCAQPEETIARMLGFLALRGDPGGLAREVDAPVSLGRHRLLDAETAVELEHIGGGALARFGYTGW